MRRTNHGSHYYKATVIFRQQQSQRQIFFEFIGHLRTARVRKGAAVAAATALLALIPGCQQLWPSFFLSFLFSKEFVVVARCSATGGCFSQDPSGDSQEDVHNLSFPCVLFSFLLPSDSRRSRRKQNGKKDSQRSLARPVRAYTQTVGRCASRSQPRGRRGGGRKVRRWRRHRIRKWKIAAAAVGQTKRVVNFQGEIKLKASWLNWHVTASLSLWVPPSFSLVVLLIRARGIWIDEKQKRKAEKFGGKRKKTLVSF